MVEFRCHGRVVCVRRVLEQGLANALFSDDLQTRSHSGPGALDGSCGTCPGATLQHGPEALDAVGMGHVVDVLTNTVVDSLMVKVSHALVWPWLHHV